jgi:NAD(P)-dependent dehydrogenase (short-subunit alcohol dehydrogenase family)
MVWGAFMSVAISLAGKTALITGGSRGIGAAMARAFVASGARVCVASRKPGEVPPNGHAVLGHTGKEDECKELVRKAIAELGTIDILVNNAATNPYFGRLLDVDMGAWDKIFEVNLKGYFWMAREVARHLQGRDASGSIVNVTSVDGMHASPMRGPYGMSKAAVISLTETLAAELAPAKIRVNAIAPGLVKTKLAAALTENEELSKHFTDRAMQRRYAHPDEIAGAAIYLASDAASYTTGQTIVVDGGYLVS